MRFTSILTNLILEQSRFQVLYDKMVKPSTKEEGKKNKGLMDFETLKSIIFADPTTRAPQDFDRETATPQDMDNVKVGKLTQAKQLWGLVMKPTQKVLNIKRQEKSLKDFSWKIYLK
jgi:hypothetical protein